MENQENHITPDYQHGLQSGVEKLDKSHFEGYLSNQSNFEWLDARMNEKKEAIIALNLTIAETKIEQKQAFEQQQSFILEVGLKSKIVASLQSKTDGLSADINSLKERYKQASSPYSLLAGVLYLLAGIAFVAGDLIISHEIVAYALNIHNPTEAWLFAIGLAMLSVLLKPAYERLIEEPYLKQTSPKAKRIYSIFQAFLLIFAVGTMFILGWFRYEAYRTEQLKAGINQQIRTLQNNAQPIDPSQATPQNSQLLMSQMEQQLKRFEQLNVNLVNSPWALASFVLSGILFAVAGAICLGIAFPILQSCWFRWLQAGPKLKKLDKKLIETEALLNEAEEMLTKQIVQKNVAENTLENLPKINDLENKKEIIIAEMEAIWEDIKLQKIESRIANYNDGYGRGQATYEAMTHEEQEEYRKMALGQVKTQQEPTERIDKTQRIYRSNGLRPHQAIRKVVSDGVQNNN